MHSTRYCLETTRVGICFNENTILDCYVKVYNVIMQIARVCNLRFRRAVTWTMSVCEVGTKHVSDCTHCYRRGQRRPKRVLTPLTQTKRLEFWVEREEHVYVVVKSITIYRYTVCPESSQTRFVFKPTSERTKTFFTHRMHIFRYRSERTGEFWCNFDHAISYIWTSFRACK